MGSGQRCVFTCGRRLLSLFGELALAVQVIDVDGTEGVSWLIVLSGASRTHMVRYWIGRAAEGSTPELERRMDRDPWDRERVRPWAGPSRGRRSTRFISASSSCQRTRSRPWSDRAAERGGLGSVSPMDDRAVVGVVQGSLEVECREGRVEERS
jgi:hypothetical protein